MGANLLISLLEIERDKQPDWGAAHQFIDQLSPEACAEALAIVHHEDDPKSEIETYLDAGKPEAYVALEECINGWNGLLRKMTKIPLAATDMLIAADVAFDEPDEMRSINMFAFCGAAEAAGFHVDDEKRIAVWMNKPDAQDLVNSHQAYVDCGMMEPDDEEDEADAAQPSWLYRKEQWDEQMAAHESHIVEDVVPIVHALEAAGLKPLFSEEAQG